MVKLLKPEEVDAINEAVDIEMSAAEETEARGQFAKTASPGDLSDGGNVNGARLTPMLGGKPQQKGRANARRAWMWNGTETVMPLAWNPDGTAHDGGRRYLLKRHCLCCGSGGFRGARCLNCVKNNCSRCNGSSDRKKIIPLNYLKKEDVPYPERFYGDIPCFLPFCIRRADRGFKTEEDMRMHARSRHRMEYQAHQETLNAAKADQVEVLQRRLDTLLAGQANGTKPSGWTPEKREAARARMAVARAARKQKAAAPAVA